MPAQMPRGFQPATERALKLAGRKAFLAGAEQMDGLKPQPQRKVAILENRSDAHRERLPASVALAQARTGRLALQAADLGRVRIPAMGARRASRPKLGLDVGEGRVFVVEPIG